jgi:hypothetical protein
VSPAITSLRLPPQQRRAFVKLHTLGLQREPEPAGGPGASRSAARSKGRAGAGRTPRRGFVPAGAARPVVPACRHQGSQDETSGDGYPACLRIVGSSDSSVVSCSHWPAATCSAATVVCISSFFRSSVGGHPVREPVGTAPASARSGGPAVDRRSLALRFCAESEGVMLAGVRSAKPLCGGSNPPRASSIPSHSAARRTPIALKAGATIDRRTRGGVRYA